MDNFQKTKQLARLRRHRRVRARIQGTASRPRFSVFRSLKHLYVQLIDDEKGHTLLSASDVILERPHTFQVDPTPFKKRSGVEQLPADLTAVPLQNEGILNKFIGETINNKYYLKGVGEAIESQKKGEVRNKKLEIRSKKEAKTSEERPKRLAKVAIAYEIGKFIAQKALKQGIKKVVFDRDGYKYHGQVKAVAEGAREGGLKL